MSRLSSIPVLRWVALVALCMCIAGGVLIHQASRMPAVSDRQALADLKSMTPPRAGGPEGRAAYERFKKEWFEARDAILTPRWALFDRGLSALALGLSGIAVLVILRAAGIRRLADAGTPRSGVVLLALVPVALLLCVVASFARYGEMQKRGLNPYWADSPVAEMTIAVLAVAAAPVLMAFGWLALRKRALPVNLWVWNGSRKWRSGLWTLAWGIAGLVVAAELVHAVWYGSYLLVPLALLWLYLILSARAVLVGADSPGRAAVSR